MTDHTQTTRNIRRGMIAGSLVVAGTVFASQANLAALLSGDILKNVNSGLATANETAATVDQSQKIARATIQDPTGMAKNTANSAANEQANKLGLNLNSATNSANQAAATAQAATSAAEAANPAWGGKFALPNQKGSIESAVKVAEDAKKNVTGCGSSAGGSAAGSLQTPALNANNLLGSGTSNSTNNATALLGAANSAGSTAESTTQNVKSVGNIKDARSATQTTQNLAGNAQAISNGVAAGTALASDPLGSAKNIGTDMAKNQANQYLSGALGGTVGQVNGLLGSAGSLFGSAQAGASEAAANLQNPCLAETISPADAFKATVPNEVKVSDSGDVLSRLQGGALPDVDLSGLGSAASKAADSAVDAGKKASGSIGL